MTDFTTITTKNTHLPDGYTRGPRVQADDCVPVILFPWGNPDLKEAIDRTIAKAGPDYDALVDGVVYWKNHSFLFGSVCYEVEGTAINTRAKAAAGIAPERIWRREASTVPRVRVQ